MILSTYGVPIFTLHMCSFSEKYLVTEILQLLFVTVYILE